VPASLLALPGIVITAALFLIAIQRLLTGPVHDAAQGFTDLRWTETTSVGFLLLLSLLIGVLPRLLLDVVEPAARTVVQLVGR